MSRARLFVLLPFVLLTLSCAQSSPQQPQPAEQGSRPEKPVNDEYEVVPPQSLDKVTEYLSEHWESTTLQNQRQEAKLLGKQFSGTLTVFDVLEIGHEEYDPPVRLLIKGWQEIGRGAELSFEVRDPQLMEKAESLKKEEKILILATLTHFFERDSGYINVGNTYVAVFDDVKKLELLPKSD